MSTGGTPAPVCVLGFDVGARRTGVAVGNTLSMSARALAVLAVNEGQPDWSHCDRLLREWSPQRLIVGEPLTLEGEVQPATQRARRFARALEQRYRLPVELVDERSSSREADRRFAQARSEGRAKRSHAELLDALAAQIILERWLGQHD
ncbi:Holliday junction resolvase RuvX [Aquimonas voraii]|uniref:Putative pre-16S rRNA nuclease n=1 Tax=Aquimonas voraii TaxID=265719 RepID=A0A1G6SXT7_9GAMM|nr:Holliday junction resolvase RuvX [Aquimonas voraii]SDD21027.1 putative holliday junction resolvase [Aquimonas voraii]